MAEERKDEKVMSLALKELKLDGDPIKIKLDCAKAVKTGEGKYGMWYLWFGYVENAPIVADRDKKYAVVNDWTGKISFFPTERLNDHLEELCGGNIGVEVNITKNAEEGKKGLIMKYNVEKISDGEEQEAGMTDTEKKLMKDAVAMKKAGFPLALKEFVEASQASQYEGKISEDRAKELHDSLSSMS